VLHALVAAIAIAISTRVANLANIGE